ncbi:hypothetical protein F5Y03DRAFT_7684 [Xylaria venustula]|nr:hypothetical protein F5Y03DRAFT_7684 [Xylaria venustula]
MYMYCLHVVAASWFLQPIISAMAYFRHEVLFQMARIPCINTKCARMPRKPALPYPAKLPGIRYAILSSHALVSLIIVQFRQYGRSRQKGPVPQVYCIGIA